MSVVPKPYAPACDRNKEPILEVLKKSIKPEHKNLLELGSGTGQHAVYLAPYFSHLTWTCSDLLENHEGIKLWLDEARQNDSLNIQGPLEFEIAKNDFPNGDFDIVFTANTFHIMGWEHVQLFIKQCGESLKSGALIVIYGPFNYNGSYTSDSNAQFDIWLKSQNPVSAIRDFEEVSKCMDKAGFILSDDVAMPANNRTLIFMKK